MIKQSIGSRSGHYNFIYTILQHNTLHNNCMKFPVICDYK